MGARKFNKRFELWQTSEEPDGFGGFTPIPDVLIASSWCSVKTMGLNSKYAYRNTGFGTTTTTIGVIIQTRFRQDVTYNSLNQYIKYRGDKYIIQNEPLNVDFNDSIIEIQVVREDLKTI